MEISGTTLFIYIGSGVAALLLIVVVLALVYRHHKKKQQRERSVFIETNLIATEKKRLALLSDYVASKVRSGGPQAAAALRRNLPPGPIAHQPFPGSVAPARSRPGAPYIASGPPTAAMPASIAVIPPPAPYGVCVHGMKTSQHPGMRNNVDLCPRCAPAAARNAPTAAPVFYPPQAAAFPTPAVANASAMSSISPESLKDYNVRAAVDHSEYPTGPPPAVGAGYEAVPLVLERKS